MTHDNPVEWPERLTLRDTRVHADEGQRIFTTATGYGYEKCEYVRADLLSSPPVQTAAVDGPNVRQIIFDALDLSEELRIECTADVVNALTEAGALASQAAVEGEAVAWMHTLQMEGGQTAVRLARAEVDRPWGKPGIDFDPTYSVAITPLYAHPSAAEAGVREALRTMLGLFDKQGNWVADIAQLQDAVNGGYRALAARETLTDEAVDAAIREWMSSDDRSADGFRSRMRAAFDAALSLAAKRRT